MSISNHSQLVSRRNFLRGVGTSIALPSFVSLGTPQLLASSGGAPQLATTATGAPLRTAFLYFPNGAIPKAWWPEKLESNLQLTGTLEPLNAVKNHVQLLKGLDQVNAEGGPDGAGDHARGNAVFLTGVRVNKSATDVRAGVSIDQAIAQRVGEQTMFPSLELSSDTERQTGTCDSGYACAYQYNLAWKSPTQPMPPERNPRLLFERLFGSGPPEERARNLALRRERERSVLDFILTDAQRLQSKLAAEDREKLEQYLTGVRDIEQRITRAERLSKEIDPSIVAPSGIPADLTEHMALTFDMLLLAFQTDMTRVATVLLAHDGSNRSFDHIGIFEGHHDLTHHREEQDRVEKVAAIDRWYAEQFARFLKKLEETPDVDGNSLLHNSMIVYGSGNADGNRHTHTNLPIVLAGHGGGTLTPGRLVDYGSKPLCNLFLSLADRMGVDDLARFGDSTGRVSEA